MESARRFGSNIVVKYDTMVKHGGQKTEVTAVKGWSNAAIDSAPVHAKGALFNRRRSEKIQRYNSVVKHK